MKPWEKLESRPLLRGELHLDEDLVRLPDGRRLTYLVMRAGAFVCVCGVTSTGLVVLVRQYRYPLGAFTFELPSGATEEGETPLEAARRELCEETGFEGGEWEAIGSFWTMPGRSNQVVHQFVAVGVEQTRPISAREPIECELKPFEEALTLVSATKDALCLRLARERL